MHRFSALVLMGVVLGASPYGCYSSGSDSDEAVGGGGASGQSGSTGKAGASKGGSSSGGMTGDAGAAASAAGGEPSTGGDTSMAQAGAGGAGVPEPCDASALILIQRSGAMVEPVDPIGGGANWWELLEPALIDP